MLVVPFKCIIILETDLFWQRTFLLLPRSNSLYLHQFKIFEGMLLNLSRSVLNKVDVTMLYWQQTRNVTLAKRERDVTRKLI